MKTPNNKSEGNYNSPFNRNVKEDKSYEYDLSSMNDAPVQKSGSKRLKGKKL